MTDYELVDVFYTIAALSDQLILSFITLLFAFLVASYLVSASLDRKLAGIVLALYSLMALRYVVVFHNVAGEIATLADQLKERQLQSSSLDWLELGDSMSVVLPATTIGMFLAFAGSIYFFIHMRKSNV